MATAPSTLATQVPVNSEDLARALQALTGVTPVTDAGAIRLLKEVVPITLADVLGSSSTLDGRGRLALEGFVVHHVAGFGDSAEHLAVVAKVIQTLQSRQEEQSAIDHADIGDIVVAILTVLGRHQMFNLAQSVLEAARTYVRGDPAFQALEKAFAALADDRLLAGLDSVTADMNATLKRGDLQAFAARVFNLGAEQLLSAIRKRHRGVALVMLYGFSDEQQAAVGEEVMTAARQLTGRQRG